MIQNNANAKYNVGGGVGFKIKFLKVLNFNLQGGYGFYNITQQLSFTPTGEVGLYYNF